MNHAAQLQLGALRCIELSAAPERNRETIMKAGGLRTVLELLSSTNATLRFHALTTLSKLALVDRVREGLLKAKALSSAVALLEQSANAAGSKKN